LDGLIRFEDGARFATGVAPYFVGGPGEREAGRLVIEVSIEGLRTTAAVDTGGFYFVCRPELAEGLEPFLTDPLFVGKLEIRGTEYDGDLYRLTVELVAEEGEGLLVDATVFLPKLKPHQEWKLPSFMGFQGMLDRIRFAVDPEQSLFSFGPLGEG
jgi:hypothetical protein